MTLPETAPFNFAIMQHDRRLTNVLYQVTGITDLYQHLRDKVEIVVDLHTTFYGTQEVYFRDINGYVLSFAEAVQKM